METWVVTGGAGFIGATVVRKVLATTPHRVVVLDALTYAGHRENLEDVAKDPRYTFVYGDIADRETVERVYREHAPSAVLHLAAETHVDRSIDGPRAFIRTNVHGTLELLEGARAHVARLAKPDAERFRFLAVSTDEVFGSLGPTGKFSETSPYDPRSPYSASKAASDHLVSAYHETYKLPTILTNCSNNYGPFQFPEKLIPLALLNACEGKPIPLYGDGSNVRDWIHVEDHAEGILAALARGRPGERYGFGGDAERTNRQVLEALCDALEALRPAGGNPAMASRGVKRYRDLVTLVADRPGHDRRYAMDASKAKRELGWAPRHDFATGIRSTVAWYLEHAAWCAAVQKSGSVRDRRGVLAANEPTTNKGTR